MSNSIPLPASPSFDAFIDSLRAGDADMAALRSAGTKGAAPARPAPRLPAQKPTPGALADRPRLTTADRDAAFDEQEPGLLAFLDGAAGWSNFAASIARAIRSPRGATARQIAAAQSMRAKTEAHEAAKAAAEKPATVPGFSEVVAVLGRIAASGNDRPCLRLVTGNEIPVNVKHDIRGRTVIYWAEIYAGRVDDAGEWHPTNPVRGLSRAEKADLWALLARLRADAKATCAEFGFRTGTCACCGRPLSNPESVALGIGPICLSRAFGG